MAEILSKTGVTVASALQRGRDLIASSPFGESASLDASLILAFVMEKSRVWLMTWPMEQISASQIKTFESLVAERCQGKPVAYILGSQEFWKSNFIVTPAVLIPRPDTEILVSEALKHLKNLRDPSPRILDVGTGSGCIAISLSLELPGACVEAWDISEEALEVARANQAKTGSQVTFRNRDALDPASWEDEKGFDLVVSNPPYIARSEAASLSGGVLNYEPHQALFAAGEGLIFYRMLALHACRVFRRGHGCIMMETGYAQAGAVCELFREQWEDVGVHQDLSGNNRLVAAFRTCS